MKRDLRILLWHKTVFNNICPWRQEYLESCLLVSRKVKKLFSLVLTDLHNCDTLVDDRPDIWWVLSDTSHEQLWILYLAGFVPNFPGEACLKLTCVTSHFERKVFCFLTSRCPWAAPSQMYSFLEDHHWLLLLSPFCLLELIPLTRLTPSASLCSPGHSLYQLPWCPIHPSQTATLGYPLVWILC